MCVPPAGLIPELRDDNTERSKREVEAEAVAYVVGRYCGLDTSGSAFYLAAWESDDPEIVRERLGGREGVDAWSSVLLA